MTANVLTGRADNEARGRGPRATAATVTGASDTAGLARRYLALVSIFAVCGTVAAVALRLELLTPPLDVFDARTFGALLSLHGTLMMYFVALPALPGVIGAALLPRELDVPHLAMPRLARASWWLLAGGGTLVLSGFLAGGTDAGWMFDMGFGGRFTAPGLVPLALGVALAAGSAALLAISLVVTVAQWRRFAAGGRALPPLAAAVLFAGASALLAAPVLLACAVLVVADAVLGLALFAPATGGQPELFATLFRFFVSPAQSIVFVLSLGTVVTIVARRTAARPGDIADPPTTLAFGVLALAGLLAWSPPTTAPWTGSVGQHVYVLFYGVAAAAAVFVILRVLAPVRFAALQPDPPLLYAAGFLVTALLLFPPGLLLTLPATRVFLGNTSFATGQLHMTMTAALGMAFLGGLHDAWPRLSGRTWAPVPAYAGAGLVLAGTLLGFAPLFWLGLAGAPTFRANAYLPEFQVPQVLAGAGVTLLVAGGLLAATGLVAGRRLPAPPPQS